MISESVANTDSPATYSPNVTAQDWFARRIKNQRIKNRTVSILSSYALGRKLTVFQGPETWKASRGMEHKPEAV